MLWSTNVVLLCHKVLLQNCVIRTDVRCKTQFYRFQHNKYEFEHDGDERMIERTNE